MVLLVYKLTGTRTDSMQLADEFPMIYLVCTLAYATFSYGRSAMTSFLMLVFVVHLAIFITVSTVSPVSLASHAGLR